tara:strand:- start:1284 stop:1889 length:606 start_codon:yes stop_codon:yes gene_type:complete
MNYHKVKKLFREIWHFIWEEESILSWIVNVILAFILIKYVVYPGLGFILATSHPIVAVVSGSMEHNNKFNEWWPLQESYYLGYNISKQDFVEYKFKNGFNIGDIMILKGKKPGKIQLGDVIVFNGNRQDPIIHRVIKTWKENDKYYFQTKGDNNPRSMSALESRIHEDNVIGYAVIRVPLLGYIKIWFVELLKLFSLVGGV